MATIVFGAVNGSWSDDTKWVGGVKPTAADDAQFDATSAAAITIDTGAVCRSLDCNGYTGTVTQSGTFTIGDATAGAGNRALRLVAGMTWTNSLGTIVFVSTSATQQSVDFAGKSTGGVTFNATSNGSWQFTGAHNHASAGATTTLTKGSLDINGQTCSWGLFNANNTNVKSLTLGAAAITMIGAGANVWLVDATNTTLSAASSTITLNGAGASFTGGTSLSYGTVNLTGSGIAVLGNSNTYVNLNRTGTSAKTDALSIIGGTTTVTGILTLAGNSDTNRLLVQSSVAGTARTITNTGATMTWSNVDLQDITLGTSFDASAITGLSGDCGGNTNITFTTAATQTWTGTGGNWATVGRWSGRVPLPQDDVSMAKAFSASQTVTANMPRLGKSIDWTGATGTPTWDLTNSANTMFGSLTLITGMAVTTGTTNTFTFSGRGSHTITSATQNFTICAINAPGGSYELADDFQSTLGRNFTVTRGTFDTKNFNLTCSSFLSNTSQTRTITLGTSTISLLGNTASTIWNLTATGGLTLSATSSTIVFSATSANTRVFAGGGQSYGKLQYTVAGSTGQMSITGANTFKTIEFSDTTNARTLAFTAATTTNFTNLLVRGTAGKLMTITSVTAATHTLSKAASGVVDCDYLSVSQSIATGGATFFAGDNSTNGGSNTGWIFKTAPNFLLMF